ncbi:hypothetical protein FQN50_003391 [Emmonsiellopsis sp. PD_5]|nr:hypothetical protein FQN50_003391 [Emmonsiellopsis sp. PD_5]
MPARASPARGLADLPTEIILFIGSYSDIATLGALVRTQKRFAAILTTQLYRRAIPPNDPPEERWTRAHGVFPLAVLNCARHWKSPYVVDHVLSKMAGCEFFLSHPPRGHGNVLPLTHLMARVGNTGILRKLLLENGGIGVKDAAGRTALRWAARMKNEDTAKMLLDMGERAAEVDKKNMTPIMLAAGRGSNPSLGHLIESAQAAGDNIFGVDRNGWTVLHHAARYGNMAAIPMLLEAGADASAKDPHGEYPLLLAIRHVPRELTESAVKAMIKAFSDVNACGSMSQTPLRLAVTTKIVWLNELLLKAGANVLPEDNREWNTALHLALYKDIENPVIDLLLRYGADPYRWNREGITPLGLAAKAKNTTVALRLLQVEPANWRGRKSDVVYKLWHLTRGLPAIEAEQAALIYRITLSQRRSDGNLKRSLHLLCSARGSPQTRPGIEASIYLLLHTPSIKFYALDPDRFTPLHYASHTGKADVIEHFLIRGHNSHFSKFNGMKLGKWKRRIYASVVEGLLEAGSKKGALVRNRKGACGIDRWAMGIQDGLCFNIVNLLLGRQNIMAYIGEFDNNSWFG